MCTPTLPAPPPPAAATVSQSTPHMEKMRYRVISRYFFSFFLLDFHLLCKVDRDLAWFWLLYNECTFPYAAGWTKRVVGCKIPHISTRYPVWRAKNNIPCQLLETHLVDDICRTAFTVGTSPHRKIWGTRKFQNWWIKKSLRLRHECNTICLQWSYDRTLVPWQNNSGVAKSRPVFVLAVDSHIDSL